MPLVSYFLDSNHFVPSKELKNYLSDLKEKNISTILLEGPNDDYIKDAVTGYLKNTYNKFMFKELLNQIGMFPTEVVFCIMDCAKENSYNIELIGMTDNEMKRLASSYLRSHSENCALIIGSAHKDVIKFICNF